MFTACSSIDFEGNDLKALVYEYMLNGSLEKWMNIVIDMASALDYLHNHYETPVAHCDLKPSNVLLDNDFTTHVSDFGLAQLLCKFSKEARNHGVCCSRYGMGGKVSTVGDVHSYGILLLELFTRRRPTDGSFEDNLNLHNFVKMALPSQVMEVVDQSALCKGIEEEEVSKVGCSTNLRCELSVCLISVLQIGVVCSSDSPQDRLNMGQVTTKLLSIRETFLSAGMHEEPQNHSINDSPYSSQYQGHMKMMSLCDVKCLGIERFLSSYPSVGNFYQKISYEEILKATGGFPSQNLIGSGNFGTVYKGTLDSGGTDTIVAVK
ncbi:unnamed protein product [Camellia sinensis]